MVLTKSGLNSTFDKADGMFSFQIFHKFQHWREILIKMMKKVQRWKELLIEMMAKAHCMREIKMKNVTMTSDFNDM